MRYKGLWLIMALVIILDQWSKWLVLTKMELNEIVPVIGEFFQIMSHRNRGAAWGILQDQRWFFLVITTIILAMLLYWLWKLRNTTERWTRLALALIISGAIGNLIDRARTGEVVDFLKFHFQGSIGSWEIDYVYPLFNVADSAIVVGAILLIWTQFRAENTTVDPEVENKP